MVDQNFDGGGYSLSPPLWHMERMKERVREREREREREQKKERKKERNKKI